MLAELIKGLLPWLLYFFLSDPDVTYLGISFALAATLLVTIPHLKRGVVLDWGTVVFFFSLGAVSVFSGDYWVEKYGVLAANSALSLIALISIMIKRPFTWEYSRSYQNISYSNSLIHIQIHTKVTLAWAIVFVVSSIIHAIYLDHIGTFYLMNEVLPAALIFFGMIFTTIYPGYAERKIRKQGVAGLNNISDLCYVEIEGGRAGFRSVGKGFPIIMLPDANMTMHQWDPALISELSSDNQVYLLDYPGVGEADFKVDNINDLAVYVSSFAATVIDGKYAVVGLGFGGWVAQSLAISNPGSVARIALINSDCGGNESVKPEAAHIGESLLVKDFFEMQKDLLFSDKVDKNAVLSFLKVGSAASLEPSASDKFVFSQNKLIAEWYENGSFSQLRDVRQPSLIIFGGQDRLIPPENSRLLEKEMPNAIVVSYPESGHGVIYQQPYELASNVKGFFAALSDY